MNPFEGVNKENVSRKTRTVTDKIMAQVDKLEVGDSVQIKLHGMTVVSARGCLSNRARKMDKKFKTRMPSGEFWVLRVL